MLAKIDLYETFYYVAVLGSFSEAADQLCLTQSAVSQSIRKLELELGVSLFIRKSKKIQLTDYGEILIPHVKSALSELQAAELKIQNSIDSKKYVVRIGATETAFSYGLVDYLKEIQENNPHVRIQLVGTTSSNVLSMLLKKELNIAFVILPEQRTREEDYNEISFIKRQAIQDCFVVSKDYELQKNKKYALRELISEPFVSVSADNTVRAMIDDFFAKENLIFNPALTVNGMNQVLKLVENGLGIGIVPEALVKEKLQDGTLVKLALRAELQPRYMYLAYLRGAEDDIMSLRNLQKYSVSI